MGLTLYGLNAQDLCSNTKYLQKNSIFYIMGDFNFEKFLPFVLKKKPLAIILEKKSKSKVDYKNIIVVEDVRKIYRQDVEKFYYDLFTSFEHIGITGTKGKSTIAYTLFKCLQNLSQDVAYIGTMGLYYKSHHESMVNTTPGLNDFVEILKKLSSEKIDTLVSEVSSQAILQDRVAIDYFRHRVFTDLSEEHLDCHLNMENYFEEKAKFFRGKSNYTAYILDRSLYGDRVAKSIDVKTIRYGLKNSNLSDDLNGLTLEYEKTDFKTHLTGFFNGENIACVLSVLSNLNFKKNEMQKALEEVKFIPGRMEKITSFNGGFIYVDYAHSSESLEFVLSAVSSKVKGKLNVIFGCGGNRDPLKRPLMAKSAEKYADIIVVSNDNPRSENPLDIIKDIESGFSDKARYQIILDRKKAIEDTMSQLNSGDVLLICGKGHENYQIIGDKKEYFCDKQVVLEYAKSFS
ncbi:MAG: hypothetical protein COB02_04035 [Candidatus Cloacimonadota bacterium]|nr:MAG: hypothetical protein COB02_04035 [Candidatus Cloacimonadota bacterium]